MACAEEEEDGVLREFILVVYSFASFPCDSYRLDSYCLRLFLCGYSGQ